MRHEVLYNAGAQSLYHVPRDRYGRVHRVASATYQIVDLTRGESDPDREIVASTAATVDAATDTTDAAAGPGQTDSRAIPVADEAGFTVGHTYQIVQGDVSETFVLAASTTGQLRTVHSLRNDYTTGATVRGIEIVASFPNDEAADETDMEGGGGPYAVIWDYTIGDREYNPLEEVYVLRYSIQSPITEADVLRAWPLANDLSRERFTVQHAIAAATEDFIARLEASNKKPELFRQSIVSRVAVRDLALAYLHQWRKETEEATALREKYERLMSDLTTGQHPVRSVQVEQATNTADRDTERSYGMPRFRIS